jgi:MurNAc alpha-1-phosphate uridylyltransferase
MNRRAIRPVPGGHVPETAMVMAAGLGKRMRPLTATRPKPLVEVAGKPLIDHVFDRLRGAGIKRAVVNVHYLADTLQAHLTDRFDDIEVVMSDERARLMETGGGLVQARDLLGDAFWSSTATICGSMGRSMRSACSPRAGTMRKWTLCC